MAFALNLVLFFLPDAEVEHVLDGPTGVAVTLCAIVFVVGTALFGATMIRDRVFPAVPAWGYTVTLPLLAVLAPLDNTPLTSLVHVLGAAAPIWLSAIVWLSPRVADRVAASASRAL